MAPQNLLVLCAFLAVSSGTLLIYLVFSKVAGRTRTRDGDMADREHDPFPDLATLKSPMIEPVWDAAPVTGILGRGSGLGALIPLVLLACLWQVARMVIRQRFNEVIGKITTERPMGIDFDRNTPKIPDLRIQPIQIGPSPFDGLRGIRAPAGLGGGGAPVPGNRALLR